MNDRCLGNHKYLPGTYEERPGRMLDKPRRVCTACRLARVAIERGLAPEESFQSASDRIYDSILEGGLK